MDMRIVDLDRIRRFGSIIKTTFNQGINKVFLRFTDYIFIININNYVQDNTRWIRVKEEFKVFEILNFVFKDRIKNDNNIGFIN